MKKSFSIFIIRFPFIFCFFISMLGLINLFYKRLSIDFSWNSFFQICLTGNFWFLILCAAFFAGFAHGIGLADDFDN